HLHLLAHVGCAPIWMSGQGDEPANARLDDLERHRRPFRETRPRLYPTARSHAGADGIDRSHHRTARTRPRVISLRDIRPPSVGLLRGWEGLMLMSLLPEEREAPSGVPARAWIVIGATALAIAINAAAAMVGSQAEQDRAPTLVDP